MDIENLDLTVEQAIHDRKKLRSLVSLLYDIDVRKRFFAAKALGEIARTNPEIINQIWRRISSAFDDTMSCWGVAEGLGEIARNQPEFRDRIVSLLRMLIKDEVSCQGCIWAVGRIGQVDRDVISGFIPDLIRLLGSPEICMAGQTIWALGELKIRDAGEKIAGFLNDSRTTWIFENESANVRSLGEIAREALGKMQEKQQAY
ncbi:MAG: DVU0298 family protein [Nitrospirota bacterium]